MNIMEVVDSVTTACVTGVETVEGTLELQRSNLKPLEVGRALVELFSVSSMTSMTLMFRC